MRLMIAAIAVIAVLVACGEGNTTKLPPLPSHLDEKFLGGKVGDCRAVILTSDFVRLTWADYKAIRLADGCPEGQHTPAMRDQFDKDQEESRAHLSGVAERQEVYDDWTAEELSRCDSYAPEKVSSATKITKPRG